MNYEKCAHFGGKKVALLISSDEDIGLDLNAKDYIKK